MTPRAFIDSQLLTSFGKNKPHNIARYLRELDLFKTGKKGSEEQVSFIEASIFFMMLIIDSGKNPHTASKIHTLLNLVDNRKNKLNVLDTLAKIFLDNKNTVEYIEMSLNLELINIKYNSKTSIHTFKLPQGKSVNSPLYKILIKVPGSYIDEYSNLVSTYTDRFGYKDFDNTNVDKIEKWKNDTTIPTPESFWKTLKKLKQITSFLD